MRDKFYGLLCELADMIPDYDVNTDYDDTLDELSFMYNALLKNLDLDSYTKREAELKRLKKEIDFKSDLKINDSLYIKKDDVLEMINRFLIPHG